MTKSATEPTGPIGQWDYSEGVQGLVRPIRWQDTVLTYSFPTSTAFHDRDTDGDGPDAGWYSPIVEGFQRMEAPQTDAVRQVLDEVASFTGVSFEFDANPTSATTLTFSNTENTQTRDDENFSGVGGYPGTAQGGDMFFDVDLWDGVFSGLNGNNIERGNYGRFVIAHELGHALGLYHPHADHGSHRTHEMPLALDSVEYTVMSYRDHVGDDLDGREVENDSSPQTFMMYDIAALQHMYGASYGGDGTQKFDGDTTYKWDPRTGEFFVEGASQWVPEQEGLLNRTGRIFQTIWDGNGVDTYDFSNFGTPLDVDLRPGHWSTVSEGRLADLGDQDAVGNIANALLHRGDTRSLIENAIGGSSSDTIVGNQGDNALWGKAGNDTLNGLDGNDTLYGGEGIDTLVGGHGADTIYFNPNDSYRWGLSVVVAFNGDVNHGGLGTDTIHGNSWTFAAGDTFDLRAETFTYGAGGPATDAETWTSFENYSNPGGGGEETVLGTDGANVIRTGRGSNTVDARGGNDTVAGGGGGDELDGGAGNDTVSYAGLGVGTTFGTISLVGAQPGAAGHADTILGYDTLTDFENVVGSRGADTIIGNDGLNRLEGRNGADTIYGRRGHDTLWGQGGQDTLHGDDGADTLHGGDHSDTLYGGAGRDRLHGDGGADDLFGGAGDDVLIGGAGLDLLHGGAHDRNGDTASYHVEGREGVDFATIDLSRGRMDLAGATAGGPFERLIDIENVEGSRGIDHIIGDANANVLAGGSSGDHLRGDAGDDHLYGGDGDDTLEGGFSHGRGTRDGGANILDGGRGADTLFANTEHDIDGSYRGAELRGGAGTDVLHGSAGADHLWGGEDRDTVNGRGGNDVHYMEEAPGVNRPNDVHDGGRGRDTIYAEGIDLADGVHIDMGTGILTMPRGTNSQIGVKAWSNFEIYRNASGAGDERITGNDEHNLIVTGSGINRLEGGTGRDELRAGGGNDRLVGGEGSDTLLGEAGNDVIVGDDGAPEHAGDDTIRGGTGGDDVSAGGGDDDVFHEHTVLLLLIDDRLYEIPFDGDRHDGGEGQENGRRSAAEEDESLPPGDLRGDSIVVEGDGAFENGTLVDLADGFIERAVAVYEVQGDLSAFVRPIATDVLSTMRHIDPKLHATVTGLGEGEYLTTTGVAPAALEVEGLIARVDEGEPIHVREAWTNFENYLHSEGTSNEQVSGNGDANRIAVGTGTNVVDAGEGDDHVTAVGGQNTIDLGTGRDRAETGTGNDTVLLAVGDAEFQPGDPTVTDRVDAGTGDDRVVAIREGGWTSGTGVIDAGSAFGVREDDTFDLDLMDVGTNVDLAAGAWTTLPTFVLPTGPTTPTGPTVSSAGGGSGGGWVTHDLAVLRGFENVDGSDYGDALFGDGRHNVIDGGGGADRVEGRGGNDVLYGGAGSDRLLGGAGHDILFGGADGDTIDGGTGYDAVSYRDGTSGVTLDILRPWENEGAAAGDRLLRVENLVGSDYDDTILGGNVANAIYGRAGRDVIDGRAGADLIAGEGGADVLTGGAGFDTFVYASVRHSTFRATDTITDFDRGRDHLDVSAITSGTATWLGDARFSATGGAELRFSDGLAQLDVNGDGFADLVVRMDGLDAMGAGDFII